MLAGVGAASTKARAEGPPAAASTKRILTSGPTSQIAPGDSAASILPTAPTTSSPAATPAQLDPIPVEDTRDPGPSATNDAAFVTVVPVGIPGARIVSVAELVQREAGIRVRSAGGLGSFTSVSIRGSDAAEVAVYLDGVPLGRASSGTVDLSQIPVDGLERVEIYRGLAPPELGGQTIGGAINLVSRKGARAPTLRAAVGGGSFGTRSATAGYGFGGPTLRADASLAYRGSDGNFVYYDDFSSPFDPVYARPGIRKNNGFNQVASDVTVGAGRINRVSFGVHGFLKEQGVPGRASSDGPAPTARLGTHRLVADAAIERSAFPVRALDVRLAGHVLFQRSSFSNLQGDAVGSGLPTHFDGQSVEIGLDARVRAATGAFGLWTFIASVSDEHYDPYDLLHATAPPSSERRRGAFTASDDLRFFADRLALTPSVRAEIIDNHLARGFAVFFGQAKGSNTSDGFVSPQLAARVRVTPWLTIKGSGGRTVRVPSTIELFGDGAFILARPALRPEVAFGGDLGFVIDRRRPLVDITLEAAFFGRDVTDYIGFIPSGRSISFVNLGNERFLGLEMRGRVRVGPLTASADYTFIHGIRDGSDVTSIPGIPAHKLDLRAEVTLRPFHLHYELAFLGDVYLTEQGENGAIVPSRTLSALGLDAGPFPGLPLTLSVEIANLGDLRVVDWPLGGVNTGRTRPDALADFFDYPLPGRTVYVTLAWQK